MQYNNEFENLNEELADVERVEAVVPETLEKKESFFKRNAFFLGMLTTLLCVALVCIGIKVVLKLSGQLLIIGEGQASTITDSALLNDEVVEKIDQIYQYMNIYYYDGVDKEAIYNSIYSIY